MTQPIYRLKTNPRLRVNCTFRSNFLNIPATLSHWGKSICSFITQARVEIVHYHYKQTQGPKHRYGHPTNYLSVLSNNLFTGSKDPKKNMLINFGKSFAGTHLGL